MAIIWQKFPERGLALTSDIISCQTMISYSKELGPKLDKSAPVLTRPVRFNCCPEGWASDVTDGPMAADPAQSVELDGSFGPDESGK